MTRNRYVIMMVFGSMCIAGCFDSEERAKDSAAHTNAVPIQVTANKGKIPLVTVGTNTLYQSDVDADIALRKHLAQLRNAKVSKANLESIEKRIRESARRHYVDVQLSYRYLTECGLTVNKEAVSNEYVRILKTYGYKNLDALISKLNDREQALFVSGVLDGVAIKQALSEIHRRAKVSVTDEKVNRAIDWYAHVNESAMKTNALVYANASNVWNRVVSNNITFEEMASDCTEIEDEADTGGEWGRFAWSQLASEKNLRKHLKVMKIGDITPPVECDNGLCIVKLKGVSKALSETVFEKDDEEEESDYSNCEYQLSRIFFRLAVIWDIPERDEMRKIISAKEKEDAVTKVFSEIEKKLKVKYYK